MKVPIMSKKSNRRKIIVIAGAAVLALLVIIGIIFGIKALTKKDTAEDTGVKKATSETLKEFKEEAEKVEKASQVFFTLDDYKKYDYPTGRVITVEVNDYGKLVVLGNQFNAEALEDLIEYSGVEVGKFIGLTDVVYSIRFDKNNVVETAEGSEDDPDSILVATTETTTTELVTAEPADANQIKGYVDTILSLLKDYVKDNNLTLNNSVVLVCTNDSGYLGMYCFCSGMTNEQTEEFSSIVSESVPLEKFVGYSNYSYEINIDNNNFTINRNTVNEAS